MKNKIFIALIIVILIGGFSIAFFFLNSNSNNFASNSNSHKTDLQNPFGFHPGDANDYQWIKDLGANWSREGLYHIWSWIDTNRNGNFSFKNATLPPHPEYPDKKGGSYNFDNEFKNVPVEINLVKNICPFRQNEKNNFFKNEDEKNNYFNFVRATVERYDGDSDLGCVLKSPDCYIKGDNEYPDSKLIKKLKDNPVKYWQVCNQLNDLCSQDGCQNFQKNMAEVQKLTYLAAKEANSDIKFNPRRFTQRRVSCLF